MPILLDHIRLRSNLGRAASHAESLEIGLVNNMPDAAIEATERQFVQLLDAASGETVVHLKLFSLPEVPRNDLVRHRLANRYAEIDELWNGRFDGLIVTGTEPRAANLKTEPYWAALTKVVDWADEHTASAIWSCLAAHAAVLHIDGIERRPLADKRFGVFDCVHAARQPLLADTEPLLRIPHSRWNDLREADLVSCGYETLTRSDAAGLDMFAKMRKSLFVFFQGHPEYETGTLLREYRRDVGRYLRGEREDYPSIPLGYFQRYGTSLLNAFREQALGDRREDLLASFPMHSLEAALTNTWRSSAVSIYANWLSYLAAQKAIKQKTKNGMRNTLRHRQPARALTAQADHSAT
jgi:homoserine O-succinyltransferase